MGRKTTIIRQKDDTPFDRMMSIERTKSPATILTESATTLERSCTLLCDLLREVQRRRRKADKEAREKGEPVDSSSGLVESYLSLCIGHCVKQCDKVWERVEKAIDPSDNGIERLNQAVMLQAVYDYETALSRDSDEDFDVVCEIEEFARSGDYHSFSGVDFAAVLSRIREAVPRFKELVAEHGAEIIENTRWIRRHRDTHNMVNYQGAKYRCPLCGYGLYHYGKPTGGLYNIRCSGCNLEGWFRNEETY